MPDTATALLSSWGAARRTRNSAKATEVIEQLLVRFQPRARMLDSTERARLDAIRVIVREEIEGALARLKPKKRYDA